MDSAPGLNAAGKERGEARQKPRGELLVFEYTAPAQLPVAYLDVGRLKSQHLGLELGPQGGEGASIARGGDQLPDEVEVMGRRERARPVARHELSEHDLVTRRR